MGNFRRIYTYNSHLNHRSRRAQCPADTTHADLINGTRPIQASYRPRNGTNTSLRSNSSMIPRRQHADENGRATAPLYYKYYCTSTSLASNTSADSMLMTTEHAQSKRFTDQINGTSASSAKQRGTQTALMLALTGEQAQFKRAIGRAMAPVLHQYFLSKQYVT